MRLIIACRAIDNMAGGVERQSIALANEMVARGHTVLFLTLDDSSATSFYQMSSLVTWHKLDMGNSKVKASWSLRFQRMKKIRNLVREFNADCILAFQQGMFLSMRLFTLGMRVPVIASERESPFRYDFIREGKYKNLIFQTYRLAPHMTVQCKSYVDAYPKYLQPKITVIPNAIFSADGFASPVGETSEEKILLCVGRLEYQKNQFALIQAFSKITNDFKEWKLIFAGEGEHRKAMEKKIDELGLQEKIKLIGAVKDVPTLYKRSHLLCIPSRWEGFPNVLGEALAHGLPAVGYKGCGGVRDLIIHGENGLLAEGNGDVETLYQALHGMMKNDTRRKVLGDNAVLFMQQYIPSKVYDQWENFLQGTCNS